MRGHYRIVQCGSFNRTKMSVAKDKGILKGECLCATSRARSRFSVCFYMELAYSWN